MAQTSCSSLILISRRLHRFFSSGRELQFNAALLLYNSNSSDMKAYHVHSVYPTLTAAMRW